MRNLRHRRVSVGGDGITIELEVRSRLNSVREMHLFSSIEAMGNGGDVGDIIGDAGGDVGGDAGGGSGGETSKETVLVCDDVPFSCCPVELE